MTKPCLALLLAFVAFMSGCATPPSPIASSMATPLPALDGQKQKPSDFNGPHGMVLVFVDLDCPFSIQALSDLPLVTKALTPHQVPVLVMNLDNAAAQVKEYYAAHPAGAPVLYDATPQTTQSWKITSVPTVVLLDGGNNVLYRGNAVWGDLAPAVEKALALAPGSISFAPKGTGFG
jgi:hypothetical protein